MTDPHGYGPLKFVHSTVPIKSGQHMSGEEDKIYADASQPATLVDGDILRLIAQRWAMQWSRWTICPSRERAPPRSRSRIGSSPLPRLIGCITARPDPLERAAHTVTIDRAPCLIGIARFDGGRGRFVRATSDEKKAARTLSGQVMVANDASLMPAWEGWH